MEDKCTDNELASIAEDLQDVVKKDGETLLEDDEFLDKAIEEFDVVDSWEVGGIDDLHSADERSSKSRRRSRGSSRSQRKEDKISRRDSVHHNYRSHKISHRRPRSRSHSKPSDHRRSPRKLSDKTEVSRHSVEHLRDSIPCSTHGAEKLPDLKRTTSIETGEVNVVILTENKSVLNSASEKEALETDESPRKHPVLLKNPFAFARLRRKNSQSPDKIKERELELSPRRRTERPGPEHRLGSKSRDKSLSPYRPRHRTSPYSYDRNSRKRSISISPDRYGNKRTFSDTRPRDSGRRYGRSREGSVLSRVSSKSSLSFISSDENSPRDHDRKRSPLRPKIFIGRPKLRKHGRSPRGEHIIPSSEEFDHKLSLLLKEGKQKQTFVGESTSASYTNTAWKSDWNNVGVPQMLTENYSVDSNLKHNYDASVQQCAYPGFSTDQYNQNYYNNNQPPNYMNVYPGSAASNTVQPTSNELTNQYYPQTAPALEILPASYTSPQDLTEYQPVEQQQPLAVAENFPQSTVNATHQPFVLSDDHHNYSGINAQPIMSLQESVPSKSSQNWHAGRSAEWSKYNNIKRVPTRTNIPLTNEGNNVPEEDPMRTPPPPVISDTWREIESGEKKLSALLEEASKKQEVISRCEDMLEKLVRNDPLMERFKVTHCDNMMHFSVKEELKTTTELVSRNAMRNAVRNARRLAKIRQFQSPLLRKKTNPCLKFIPWMLGDEEANSAAEPENCGTVVSSDTTKPPKSILKNPPPVKEETCSSCGMRRDLLVSVSTQTDELVTNEIGVQVESDRDHYYPDSNYKNNNSLYGVWHRR